MALLFSPLCRDDRYETLCTVGGVAHRVSRGNLCFKSSSQALAGCRPERSSKGRLCEKEKMLSSRGSRAAKVQSFVYSMHAFCGFADYEPEPLRAVSRSGNRRR
jgi:hypothetical protein